MSPFAAAYKSFNWPLLDTEVFCCSPGFRFKPVWRAFCERCCKFHYNHVYEVILHSNFIIYKYIFAYTLIVKLCFSYIIIRIEFLFFILATRCSFLLLHCARVGSVVRVIALNFALQIRLLIRACIDFGV